MRKAVFGSVLTFLISMIFAALALVLIFNILEKVFNVNTGILLGAAGKFVCQQTEGTRTVTGAGAGAVGGGLLAGGGIAACILIPGCNIGLGVGALIFGIMTLAGAGAGGFAAHNACG